MMKIYIFYNFQQSPWGGGNQFLKALRGFLKGRGAYIENPEDADVILFNSHHYLEEVFRIKKRYPSKILIHRIDGPVSYIRGRDKIIDEIIFQFNSLFADGIIFQSNWSRKQNKRLFGISAPYEIIIHNASDNRIFNRVGRKDFNPEEKIKLIATSWSPNWRKGFEIYKFLDKNLDFSKYEMTFIGNSPIEFRNIDWIKPVPSEKLAEILKQHDIYITASQNDPCSNALIEALSCGLPAVALNDGGHPELIQKGGELFNGKEDVIEKIEKVAKNYHYYQSQIPEFSIGKVTQRYYEFAKRICDDVQNKKYNPKQVDFSTKINFYKVKFMILRWRIMNKFIAIKNKLQK